MDEAERALRRLRPASWSVAEELEEMKTTLAAEARLQQSVGYRTLFQNPIDRRRTFLSVFGLTAQAASGAMFGKHFFIFTDCVRTLADVGPGIVFAFLDSPSIALEMIMANTFNVQ